ncbi:metallophosphoesterase [Kitasatospora sp. NPDC091257]|uniref:metallophosphoesterase n=1 Tax=Kitasatospora sp. NPDC091257 TaxID=3364084 RepID=UPI003803028E
MHAGRGVPAPTRPAGHPHGGPVPPRWPAADRPSPRLRGRPLPAGRRLLAGAGRGDRALRPDRRPARRLRRRSTGVHSWRYQNVGLISLDGNDVCYNTPANLDCTKGKQKKWLESRLTALRADTGIDFIVVHPHQCTYSTCHDNGAELGAQQDWSPLFDKYQVDLVLSGHNHVYERTDPIRAGKATRKAIRKAASGDTVDPAKDGTTYVVAGGGGGGLYSYPASDTYLGHESANDKPVPMVVADRSGHNQTVKVTWSRVRYTGYCLVAAEVTPAAAGRPARMEVRSLTEDGTAVDRVTVQRG